MEKGRGKSSSRIIKVEKPKQVDIWKIRLLIVLGLFFMVIFVWWFIDPDHIGYSSIFWLLTIALSFKLLKMLHEWYHYWHVSIPVPPVLKTNWTVDIFTTFCPGEPKEMILNTLNAMQKINYSHTSYLCDEADDPELKELCKKMGVMHVTRTEKIDAKAGNINNALKQATGDICIILDPDHVPIPEMIERLLPYFEDPAIGFVQSVQAYSNQNESLVARGAAEQTYHFYGPMMMCMNTYGTVQAIGANCAFRRKALDSIGGHAAGLSEDMHTAMHIHAKGWKSVYIPEILTRGLVPATLPGYYKQQLKWSRGTFELLFASYPKLFKNFTWRQKLHYLVLPLYFLFGLVNFIDIAIPALALFLAQVPWSVDLNDFTLMFLPLCAFSLLIRIFAQRWLLEEHEKGFHLAGGLLRTATWWIFLLGFIYTIFRIKVPYIPTPKDDKPVNNWILSLPNFIALIICLTAIVYGLYIDWNPYSIAMATFAFFNACILAFVIVVGQERLLLNLQDKFSRSEISKIIAKPFIAIFNRTGESVYSFFQKGLVAFGLFAGVFLLSYTDLDNEKDLLAKRLAPPELKNPGGFYTGVYYPESDNTSSLKPVMDLENSLNTSFDIVSFYQSWGPKSIDSFPMKFLKDISLRGSVPMITWEPWTNTFPFFKEDPMMNRNKNVCIGIRNGLFDTYLQIYARKIKDFDDPIFIRFAQEPDNPAYPWSYSGGNSAEDYREAWRHIVDLFEQNGVSNVTWVWNPWKPETMNDYFPGGRFVDWVSITCLNYGKVCDKWYTFDELYGAFRDRLISYKRPIMLGEFGSVIYGGSQSEWLKNALGNIKDKYKEIKSVVFFQNEIDKNWPANTAMKNHPWFIDWTISDTAHSYSLLREIFQEKPFSEDPMKGAAKVYPRLATKHIQNSFIKGSVGNFELIVDGKPFYIKGVAYNTAHDWRDGNLPLTRRQVLKDFDLIKAMGANSIRRYEPGIYDRNILNLADEKKLKVLYGFWFDPEVDYFEDTIQVNVYIKKVLQTVEKYKDHPSILAWSVGNESWGLLKHHYCKPYLVKLRQEYIKLIEYVAERIHQIDPTHPVITSCEHDEYQLPGELAAFSKNAPSIDIMGINSYYTEQLSRLQSIAYKFDSARPYLVSEFGPRGYWNPNYTRYNKQKILIEDTDIEKGELLASEWKDYVASNKGYNIGGFAFCWRDRMEGTNTWYGITDFKGRLKPSYYALKGALSNNGNRYYALNSVEISGNENEELGRKEAFFNAEIENENTDLKLEWYLFKDDYLEKIENIETANDGHTAIIKYPQEPGNYRLYLYASDRLGNVYTASRGLRIK
jgi:cellulose synthase (UDP-forming)